MFFESTVNNNYTKYNSDSHLTTFTRLLNRVLYYVLIYNYFVSLFVVNVTSYSNIYKGIH